MPLIRGVELAAREPNVARVRILWHSANVWPRNVVRKNVVFAKFLSKRLQIF